MRRCGNVLASNSTSSRASSGSSHALRVSRRALAPPANDESDRVHLRHREAPSARDEGSGLAERWPRDGFQAPSRRRAHVATPQRSRAHAARAGWRPLPRWRTRRTRRRVRLDIETDRDGEEIEEDEPGETSAEGRRLISRSSTTSDDISTYRADGTVGLHACRARDVAPARARVHGEEGKDLREQAECAFRHGPCFVAARV